MGGHTRGDTPAVAPAVGDVADLDTVAVALVAAIGRALHREISIVELAKAVSDKSYLDIRVVTGKGLDIVGVLAESHHLSID